jgi:hypothetical protein
MLLVILNGTVAPGKMIMFGYAVLVSLIGVVTWNEAIRPLSVRFAVSLGIFVLSSGCLYLAIALSPASASLSPFEHAWRLLAIFGIGTLVSLPVARISENRLARTAA